MANAYLWNSKKLDTPLTLPAKLAFLATLKTFGEGGEAMPAETGWPKRKQSINREYKSEREGWTKDVGVIASVWLVFYVLAVTSSLLSQRPAASIATAHTLETLHPAPSH